MKKILFLLVACFTLASCHHNKPTEVTEVPTEVIVDDVTYVDMESMDLNYSSDYRWYESCIVLQDYLDEECDGAVVGVSNIFQVVSESNDGYDTHVILFTHVPGADTMEVKEAFWVGDFPMQLDSIAVNFYDAFNYLMEANCPKPHSKHCVLRKELGPIPANPQYIFGNSKAQVYVDAITGNVSVHNPVYPLELNTPLGEWP